MRLITKYLILLILALAVGCVAYPPSTSQSNTNVPSGPTNNKITKLQDVINGAKEGDVIDLSDNKYSDITNYGATINKSLTLKGSSTSQKSLNNAKLTVSSNGVVLSGLSSLSVTTKASTKITNSSLSRLSIGLDGGRADSSSGRGDETFSAASPISIQLDSTTVSENVDIKADNTLLMVKDFEVPKINIESKKVQVSIRDKASKINKITTNQVCKVILEDGTTDQTINLDVTSDGELTHINMKETTRTLTGLAVCGGLKPYIYEDETPDFSWLVVMGIYNAGNGCKSFTSGGYSHDFKESFTKIETDYTLKIGDNIYVDNGNPTETPAKLTSGEKTAVISKDGSDVSMEIMFMVLQRPQTQTTNSVSVCKSIDVDYSNAHKIEYNEGDYIDLDGIKITATFSHQGDTIGDYLSVVTDYKTNIPLDRPLTTNDTQIIIKYDNYTCSIPITVYAAHTVTYVVNEKHHELYNIVKYVKHGDYPQELENIELDGKVFLGWYNQDYSVEFNFAQPITTNVKIYAKWEKIIYTITYHDEQTLTDVTYDVDQNVVLHIPTDSQGRTFLGWYDNEACTGEPITGWQPGKMAKNIKLWAKWNNPDTPTDNENTYTIVFHKNDDSDETLEQQATYGVEKELDYQIEREGYRFVGWATDTDGEVIYRDKEKVTKNKADITNGELHLYAVWEKVYGINVDEATYYKISLSASSVSNNEITITLEDGIEKETCKWYLDGVYLSDVTEDSCTIKLDQTYEGITIAADRYYEVMAVATIVNDPITLSDSIQICFPIDGSNP